MSSQNGSIFVKFLSWCGFIFGLIGVTISALTYFSTESSLESSRKIEADRVLYEAMDLLLFKPTGTGELSFQIERGRLLTSEEDRFRLENARRKIEVLKKLDPEREELKLLKIAYFAQFGDIKEFERVLLEEIEPPKRADTLMLIAAFWANIKESPEPAKKYFNLAVSADPKNAGVYRAFGGILHSFNENQEAIKQLRKALSLSPNDTEIINDLAHVYSESGDVEKAERILRANIGKGIADARTFNSLGAILFYQEDIEESLKFFKMAVDINPNAGMYQKNLSLVYARLGNHEASERHKRLASLDGRLSNRVLNGDKVFH